jgi:hypothetical protein
MDRTRAVTVLRCLLLAVPLLASQAGAQQGDPPEVVTSALRNGPAATICVAGAPLTVWLQAPLPPAIRAELEVHEAIHRRQLAGDCDARLAQILGDRHVHAEVEAEAGCAQMAYAVPAPLDRTFALGKFRDWLYDRFPDLPRDTLNAVIARRCGLWKAS